MYLIIFDPPIIRDSNRYYNFISGEYYNRIIRSNPDISMVTKSNIDEILIYSGAKDDEEKPVKIATCSALEHTDTFLKIEYESVKPIDITCKQVKGRVYRYCMQNDLLEEKKFSPNLIVIDDIQHYTDIKIGKLTPRYVSIMSQLDEYQKQGDWLSIVKLFPNEKAIKNSEYWNDVMCLSKLSFALSMLAVKAHKTKARKIDHNSEYNFSRFFLLTNDRCLELDPETNMHISARAYYYYDLYMTEKKDDSYTKALSLYETLVSSSMEWYKEKYRFTKLRQMHFEWNQWSGRYSDNWLPTSRNILNSYQELIESYEELDELRKKQYNKIYLKALFGYSIFSIDMFFAYWDDYVKLNIFGQEIKSYRLKEQQLKEIVKVEEYLKRLYTHKNFDNLSQIELQDKPNYFEVQYRLAQVEQIKGIVYIMKGKNRSEFSHFFEESNNRIEALLTYAKKQKEQNAKFNFPHYAKLPKAINLYFLEKYEECHRCFYNAREYMLYEEGCIYALCKDYSSAVDVLSKIPDQDKCYNKAQKLLSKINEYEN